MREMKDSGIEWIGQIPKDWTVTSFRAFVEERIERNKFNQTTELLSLSFALGVTLFKDKVYNKDRIKTNFEEYNIVHKDDLVLSPNDIIKGSIFVSKYYGCISPMYYIFSSRCKETHNLYYLSYLLRTKEAGRRFFFIARGLIGSILDNGKYVTRRMTVSRNDLMTFKVLLPSSKEQDRIVKFLDTQCSKIDATAEDIQKEISLLEDYKKSVITEAVTQGLNPDAEMKDSGIEWIGEIPKDWEVHPVYVYFEEGKTKNYRMQEQNLLSLSYGRIIRKDINTNGGLLPASFNTYNVVEAGDIIIRPTDLQNDKRSLRTGLVKEQGIITSAYIDLRPKDNVNSKYYHYLLHSYDIIKVFYNMGNGVRQGLNFSEFAKLLLLEPTTVEQQQIADYLDTKCSEIDTLIADKKSQLDILADYKKSLIYEYVTGKKEVPVNE